MWPDKAAFKKILDVLTTPESKPKTREVSGVSVLSDGCFFVFAMCNLFAMFSAVLTYLFAGHW